MGNDYQDIQKLFKKKKIKEWEEEEFLPLKTNKWEVTPRTATQSKRLKWDQTPLGIIKVDDTRSHNLNHKFNENRWDLNNKNSELSIVVENMSIREINMCLPTKGYKIYNYGENSKQIDEGETLLKLPDIPSTEKDFFEPIFISNDEEEAIIYRALLFIKNGNTKQRKVWKKKILKQNQNKTLEKVVLLCMSLELSIEEKNIFVEIIKSLLKLTAIKEIIYKREMIFLIAIYLSEPTLKLKSLEILSLIYSEGFDCTFQIIKEDIKSTKIHIRESVAEILATMGIYFGIEKLLEVLTFYSSKEKSYEEKNTVIKTVFSIAFIMKRKIILFLYPFLNILKNLLTDENRYIRVDSCNSLSYIFNIISPYKSQETDTIFFLLKKMVKKASKVEIQTYIRCMAYISQNDNVLAPLVFQLIKQNETDIKAFEKISDKLNSEESKIFFITVVPKIFSEDLKYFKLAAKKLCIKMCKYEEVTIKILEFYRSPKHSDFISEIFSNVPDLNINNEHILKYYTFIYNSIQRNDLKTIDLLDLLLYKKFFNYKYIEPILYESLKCIKNKDTDIQLTGLKIMRRISKLLNIKDLSYLGNLLFENINDNNTKFVASVLKTIYTLYNSYKFKPIEELIPNILPLLKTKNLEITENSIFLIHTICVNSANNSKNVNNKEWMRLAFEVVDCLTSWNKEIIKKATDILGFISKVVGPQEIINILMDGLQSEDKNLRQGSSLGIAVVAGANGTHTVIPTLLTDYAIPDRAIQVGILKTIINILDLDDSDVIDYIYMFIPVVEDALIEKEVIYRVLGLEIVKKISKLYKPPLGDRELLIHLLNMIWINIMDFTPHIKILFNECIYELSLSLGSEYLYKYLIQGIYHPAKKVSERYNEIFEIIKNRDPNGLSSYYFGEVLNIEDCNLFTVTDNLL